MIKDCNVLINNEAVTVVRFEEVDVQLPSIHRSAKTIRVCYNNGKYSVVDDDYREPELLEVAEKPQKRRIKKTTTTEAQMIENAE